MLNSIGKVLIIVLLIKINAFITNTSDVLRGVSRFFFIRGQIPLLGVVEIQNDQNRTRKVQKKSAPNPSKNFALPRVWGGAGGEMNILLTKERLVL